VLRTSSRLIVDGSTPIFRAMCACEWPLLLAREDVVFL
jgi:hypothetical protein